MDTLQTFLSSVQPQQILDVATGSGTFIQLIQSFYQDYDCIIGIDTLDIAIRTARKNFQHDERTSFQKMSAYQMEFDDSSFDMVVLSNSLHHMNHHTELCHEMCRVLKPGGYIVISEMISNDLSKAQLSHLYMHHFAAEIDRLLGDVHNDTYTSDELLQVIKEHCMYPITNKWVLTHPVTNQPQDEDYSWYYNTIDRLIQRIPTKEAQKPFIQKGQDIKQYIAQNGFKSATTMIVVIQK